MKDYARILAAGDISGLEQEDYLNEALYDAAVDEYCLRSGTSWVAASQKLLLGAAAFGNETKKAVREFLTEAKKQITERKREILKEKAEGDRLEAADPNPLNLSEEELERTKCPNYSLDENGIYEAAAGGGRKLFCHTPLAVTMEYSSAEEIGTYYKLVFLRTVNGKREVCSRICSAEVISSKNQILKLAMDGVLVNTSNASSLVNYITECIAFGQAAGMPSGESTPRFGWTKDGKFSPYDDGVMFTGDEKHRQLFEAATSVKGDPAEYMEHMREIRKMGRLEINACISGAMASLMLGTYLISIPFILHFSGETDSGKSMGMRIALSQIGDPMEGALMGDYRGSAAGIEARAGCLYNLPLALDDTSKMSKDLEKNIEGLVYNLCAGQGRTLGTRDGGNRAIKKWNCVVLSTGESRISSFCRQGGGQNRVLEIDAGDGLAFESPEREVLWLMNNHGHIVRPFLKLLRTLGQKRVMEIYEQNKRMIKEHLTDNVLAKQLQPLAVILTSDEILTEHIYHDGVYLKDRLQELVRMLKTADEVSDGARAYEVLKDVIAGNERRFYMNSPLSEEAQGEQWGWRKPPETEDGQTKEYVYITGTALRQVLGKEGFNSRKFIVWALKNGITEADKRGNAPVHHLKMTGGKAEQQRAWKILLKTESLSAEEETKAREEFLQTAEAPQFEPLPWE